MSQNSERNQVIDIFRGLAILMVVIGHTLDGSTANCRNSLVYNIIWTLQMPLFMMISGYVSKYSRNISDITSLWNYLKKRSFAYLFPWLIWTFVIRGLVFGNHKFLDPAFLFWHMDYGYWFLTSLWMICVIFGIGHYFFNRLCKNKTWLWDIIFTSIFSCLLSLVLIVAAKFEGITFLGIKYTLYYTPFFLSGFIYSKVENNFQSSSWFHRAKAAAVFASALCYFAILLKFDIVSLNESIPEIALRISASVSGCIAFFGIGSKLIKYLNNKSAAIFRSLSWVGAHSLEIYLVHFLILISVKNSHSEMFSIAGAKFFIFNFTIIMTISILAIILINQSKLAKKILFAK